MSNAKTVQDAAAVIAAELGFEGLLPDEARAVAASHLGSLVDTAPAVGLRSYPTEGTTPRVGEVRWVHAYGRQRRGLVVKVTRTKARVAFVTPSNMGTVYTSEAPHNQVREEPIR